MRDTMTKYMWLYIFQFIFQLGKKQNFLLTLYLKKASIFLIKSTELILHRWYLINRCTHVRRYLCYLTCLSHFIRSTAYKSDISYPKRPISIMHKQQVLIYHLIQVPWENPYFWNIKRLFWQYFIIILCSFIRNTNFS